LPENETTWTQTSRRHFQLQKHTPTQPHQPLHVIHLATSSNDTPVRPSNPSILSSNTSFNMNDNAMYIASVVGTYWLVSISMVYLNKILMSNEGERNTITLIDWIHTTYLIRMAETAVDMIWCHYITEALLHRTLNPINFCVPSYHPLSSPLPSHPSQESVCPHHSSLHGINVSSRVSFATSVDYVDSVLNAQMQQNTHPCR
jgi:hypothetical protein